MTANNHHSPNLCGSDLQTTLHGLAWAMKYGVGCKPLGSPKWPHAMQKSRAQVLRATLTHNRIGNLAAVMLPCAASLPTDAPGGLSC